MKNYLFLLFTLILFFSCSENEIERNILTPPDITIESEWVVEEDFDLVARIPVLLSEPSSEDIVIEFNQIPNTAREEDYEEEVITVTIPSGETKATVTITIVDDNINESTESFTVNGNVTIGSVNTISLTSVVTILESPDDFPKLILTSISVNGNGVDSQAIVPLRLSNPSSQDVTVDVVLTEGSATFDDFIEEFITVVIPAGETNAEIVIEIINDNINEGVETFSVAVFSPEANSATPVIISIIE